MLPKLCLCRRWGSSEPGSVSTTLASPLRAFTQGALLSLLLSFLCLLPAPRLHLRMLILDSECESGDGVVG